jgi:hypothetical protein
MISTAAVVKNLIREDEFAYECLKNKILNKEAYAQKIQSKVEKVMSKKVKVGTIGTALRRLEKNEQSTPSIKPDFKLSSISIKSPLYEVTYPIRDFDFSILTSIYKELDKDSEFIASTQGSQEVTLIVSQNIFRKLKFKFGNIKPIIEINDLGAVYCNFSSKYFSEPNLIYALVSQLAVKKIDLIEIISTYTEVIFIVRQNDLTECFNQLKKLLQ